MGFNLSKQYQYLQRYRQITQLLIKNGLGFLVDWLDLSKYLPFKERFNKEKNDLNKEKLAKRINHLLQELGPTFIKLGQVLSTRSDLLPPVYIKELRKLQDKVQFISFDQIRKILVKELGENYEEKFIQIDKEPRAAASIAQTHHAVLKDGTNVILKIQRPGLEQIVAVDLKILEHLAELAEEKKFFSEFLEPTKIISEFSINLKHELDFQREIANIKKFRDNFRSEDHIIVPRVFDYLSTKRLIVMEEIKGIKLSQIHNEEKYELKRSFLAALGAKSLMKQVLIDGFFHADPHPGNIFIIDNDKLAYIDFGMMGQLTSEDCERLSILFIALLKKNINIIIDLLIEIGITPENINLHKFKLEMQDLFNRYYGIELKKINLMVILDDLQRIFYKYHIYMPEEFFLLIRAIGVSEGVGSMLDPSFNLVNVGNDFVKELLLNQISIDKLITRNLNKLWEIRKTIKGLPGKHTKIIDKIINDDLTIKFKHLNLEGLINKIDIISNRLSITLIISALIIGSSMLLQIDLKPMILGIPILGFLGYTTAGVLGVWLVIAIIRSGKF